MKKVLFLTMYDQDGTYWYRQAPLQYLNNENITVERKPYQGNIGFEFFLGYDILFLERPSSQNDLSIVKLAKQCGLRVVVDFDDDCLHVDVLNPMWHHYAHVKEIVMECIALSDEIWVSTPGIKKSFSLLNNNIHVIPNCLNDYVNKIENKKPFNPTTKKAFWRGGSSHESDVYQPGIAEKLVETINNNTEWVFQFLGFRFIWLEMRCGKNYTPVSQMPLLQYMEYINTENPNIVFCPLQNTKFNESKSNISWLESTYAGACFFGNKSLPEFNLPTIRDYNELDIHLSDDDRMEALRSSNERSWTYIQQNLLLSKVNLLRIERLLAL
jgi:hypothetical protein